MEINCHLILSRRIICSNSATTMDDISGEFNGLVRTVHC